MSNSKTLNISLLGENFTIAEDENLEYMKKVLGLVHELATEVQNSDRTGKMSKSKAAILTSINVADEYYKLKEENEELKKKLELQEQMLNEMVKHKETLDRMELEKDKIENQISLTDEDFDYMNNKQITKLEKAIAIALKAHRGMKDKLGRDYILHPLEVMLRMNSDEERITAVLHDVVEDTDVTLEELKSQGVPEIVLDALELLTHDEIIPYMDYIKKLATNDIARAVKKQDLLHNTSKERVSQFRRMNRKKSDEMMKERYMPALRYLK